MPNNGQATEKLKAAGAWANVGPFQEHLGIEVTSASHGSSATKLPWRAELCNRKGDVHGGAISTLIDITLSQAIKSVLKDVPSLATVNLNVNFLGPATGALLGFGKTIRVGQTMTVAEATVSDEKGNVVAHATGLYRSVSR